MASPAQASLGAGQTTDTDTTQTASLPDTVSKTGLGMQVCKTQVKCCIALLSVISSL